jgi:hypothetical protein
MGSENCFNGQLKSFEQKNIMAWFWVFSFCPFEKENKNRIFSTLKSKYYV